MTEAGRWPAALLPVLIVLFVCGVARAVKNSTFDCRNGGVLSTNRRPWRSSDKGGDGAAATLPPRFSELSAAERAQFTRCGAIPVEESMFVDDSGPPGGTFYQFSADHTQALVQTATTLVQLVRKHGASQGSLLHARRRRQRRPSESEVWLLEALSAFFSEDLDELLPSNRKSVLIFGSMSPWIEALCLAFGATDTTTVEYNRLAFHHSSMSTVTVNDFWAAVEAGTDGNGNIPGVPFAAILSISSFDHDGLGRYGDPIAPDGDIMTMRRILSASERLLAPNGASRMFLTVPLGPDLLAWNLMRRYGRLRLPLLLSGWHVVQAHGFEDSRLDLPHGGKQNFRQSWEPVLVLAKGRAGHGITIDGPEFPWTIGGEDSLTDQPRPVATRDGL